MLKIILGIVSAVILVSITIVFAVAGTEIKRKANDWQPIIELRIKGINAFVDRNSLSTTASGNSKFSTGEILMSYDKPTEVTINGKKIVIRSMVKSLIAECSMGIVAPIYDMYFSVLKPDRESLPITGTEYTSDIRQTATPMAKSSIIYHVMCPEYI